MPGGELERAETAAFADLMSVGFEVARIGGAVCAVADALPGVREFNRVMGLGITEPCTPETLDQIADFYGQRVHYVSLCPEAEGAGPLLAERGYEPDYAWMKFVRPTGAELQARTDLRLERIGPEKAGDFADVEIEGYGMPAFLHDMLAALPGRPGWSCWVAYDGAAAVGAGALYIDGDSGWLGFGATRPEARGRGAQSAILAARIREAAEAGCATVTTETGVRTEDRPSKSYRNILRAGFEEAYARPNLRSPAAGGAA